GGWDGHRRDGRAGQHWDGASSQAPIRSLLVCPAGPYVAATAADRSLPRHAAGGFTSQTTPATTPTSSQWLYWRNRPAKPPCWRPGWRSVRAGAAAWRACPTLHPVRLVIARCQVDYVGRLTAHLPMA